MRNDSDDVQRKASRELSRATFPKVRGNTIRVDENGLICLNDIHRASGFKTDLRPSAWRDNASTGPIQFAVMEKLTGKSGHWSKAEWRRAIYVSRGENAGVYADIRLALAYAEYLNPKLALEVKEVFLRYKAGDATLADEVLQRAAPEANEWAGTRALGRSVRNQYTAALRDHGVQGKDYGACTNTLYKVLFDKNASALKKAKGLAAKATLRDSMSNTELVFIMAGETLSTERIREEECDGGEACRLATSKSARFIRSAIDADRMDRKGRQPDLI
jgi:hypothetical protein